MSGESIKPAQLKPLVAATVMKPAQLKPFVPATVMKPGQLKSLVGATVMKPVPRHAALELTAPLKNKQCIMIPHQELMFVNIVERKVASSFTL